MGIRVNKMLGWGLTDLIEKDVRLAESKWRDLSVDDYNAWLEQQCSTNLEAKNDCRLELSLNRIVSKDVPRYKLDPESCYERGDSDGGLPNVICVRPLWEPDWHRVDDTLDWVEENERWLRDPVEVNYVKVLDSGPHPYNGLYMDGRNGKDIPLDAGIEFIRLTNGLWYKPSEGVDQLGTILAKELDFETLEEAKANIVPRVPSEIRHLCEFLGLFTSNDVWLQLRPMLYTFWR